jgi:hypothetical protein
LPARVRLDVSASAGETSTTVTRLNPDGTTTAVRTTDGNPLPLSAGTGLIYDYEMFYGQLVSYSSLETPGTVSASVEVDQSQVWLVHPGVPALSQPLDLLPGSLLEEAYTTKQGVFYAMGRTNPLVVTDGARKGASSQLVILTSTLSQIDQLRALVSDAGVLLLNIPAQLNLGFQSCYVAAQDMKIARLTDVVIDTYRSITLPFVVVDRPVGGTMAQRILTDLMTYPSLSAVQAAYSSLNAVLAGP